MCTSLKLYQLIITSANVLYLRLYILIGQTFMKYGRVVAYFLVCFLT